MQVSDFRGRVKPNTRVYDGTGTVDGSADVIAAVEQALTKKYSWQFRLTQLTDVIKNKLGKTVKQRVVAIHLTMDIS